MDSISSHLQQCSCPKLPAPPRRRPGAQLWPSPPAQQGGVTMVQGSPLEIEQGPSEGS